MMFIFVLIVNELVMCIQRELNVADFQIKALEEIYTDCKCYINYVFIFLICFR